MKFYFCETCGKRITEVELNEGSARNKQVKGIFCEDCAVGVNTIEFEPLKLEVNPSAPPRSTPSFGTPTARSTPKFGMSRSTPNSGAPIVRSTPNSGSPTVKEAALEKPLAVPKGLPASQKAMLVAAGFIMATGMAMLMVGLKKPAPTPVLSENSGVVQTPKVPPRPPALEIPAPSASPAKQEPPAAAAEVPTIPLTQPSDAESRAASSFEEVRQFRGLAADDAAGRAAVLEAFLKEHGDSIVAARARLLLESFKKAPEAAPATAPAPNVVATIPVSVPEKTSTPTPAALPAEPPKDEIAEADKAYVVFLNEYVALLRKHDRAGAAQRMTAADENSVLKPLQKDLAQNRKALAWFDDLEAAMLAGVEKLRDVDDFNVISKSGQSMHVGKKAPFQFQGRKDDTLTLGSKEMAMSLSMSTFSIQTWENLVELGLSNDAAGILRRGFAELLSLGANDSAKRTAVKSTLARARTTGAAAEDVDYLLRLIDVSSRGAHESLAEAALHRFEQSFETKNWVEADRLGRQLLTDYADTSIVKSKTGLRDMVVSARAKGSPVRDYTLVFQEGEPIYDANIDKYSGTEDCYLYQDWPTERFKDYSLKGRHNAEVLMTAPGWIRPLIQFKVFQRQGGPLPDEAEIVNANLSLYKTGAYDPRMEAKPCTVPWKIDEVTWNSAASNTPWKKPGGDASDYVAAKFKGKWDPCWYEFDVTESMRQGQKDGKFYGWFVLCSESSNIVNLASSKNPNNAWRPKLTLKVRTTAMK